MCMRIINAEQLPLGSCGLAIRTDLCKAGQVGLSLVGLALSMQLENE